MLLVSCRGLAVGDVEARRFQDVEVGTRLNFAQVGGRDNCSSGCQDKLTNASVGRCRRPTNLPIPVTAGYHRDILDNPTIPFQLVEYERCKWPLPSKSGPTTDFDFLRLEVFFVAARCVDSRSWL